MHIGLVIRRLVGRNGEELSTAELADELVRRGQRVTVLSAGEAEPPAGGGYEAVGLGIGRLKSKQSWAAFERAVQRERGARGIEVLHSMGPAVGCDVYQPRGGTVAETYERYLAMPRSRWGRWRVELRIRFSPSIRARIRQEREFYARRPLPVMIAMSGYVARQMWHHYGLPGERVHTVFGAVAGPAVDGSQREQWRRRVRGQLSLPDSTTLLLFVAQQFGQKGLGYLIEALSRAESGGAAHLALAVIGRDDPSGYRRQAARLGLTSPVHYLGELERAAVREHYAAAEVLVLPTIYDCCSRTVLEALAMGTPAITTEHNGAGELVDERGAGVVVHSAWAIQELAGAIVRATDPAERGRWSSAAAGLADYVSVKRMAGELLEIYGRLQAVRPGG